MKPEKLLDALNDIDSDLIAGAHAPQTRSRPRFTLLIAAVLVTAALTATAFASETISGWFEQYFERQNDVPLSSEQVQYIEANELVVGETKTKSGYDLELKSVLADSSTIYITLGITSPDVLPFDEDTQLTFDSFDFYDQNRKTPQALSAQVLDDGDSSDYTTDLILEYTLGSWNESDQWTLHIKELQLWIHDVAYEQNLLDTKYAGQENFMLTDEEAALAYRFETLAEGPWEFSIDLSTADSAELEMVTDPITAQSCCGFKPDGSLVYEEVTINSVIIRPLSATIQTELTESRAAPDFTPTIDEQIFVVMKDSSRIQLHPDWGMSGKQHFSTASPIVLTEVDHVLLADGTKIMAP